MEEAHAVWKGLVKMKSQGITEYLVFGDSRMLIQAMITTPKSSNMKLSNLIKRIHFLSHSFQKIEFFHILRSLTLKKTENPIRKPSSTREIFFSTMRFKNPSSPKAHYFFSRSCGYQAQSLFDVHVF
jgi:hypothetical protein